MYKPVHILDLKVSNSFLNISRGNDYFLVVVSMTNCWLVGYLTNMVVRATLQDLPSPTLAFVAFAGPPISVQACLYNPSVQAPTIRPQPTILSPSPTICGLQSFSLYRHAHWAAHDTTGNDFTYMPIPCATLTFVPIYVHCSIYNMHVIVSRWTEKGNADLSRRSSCMVNSNILTCLLVLFSGALDKQTNKQIQKHVLH